MRHGWLLILLTLIVGCGDSDISHYSHGTLKCGRCRRIIYEGKIIHYRGGFQWPAGEINHCKEGDKNCVRRYHDTEWYDTGNHRGYNDAVEGKPKRSFTDFYHEDYIEGYNTGYAQGLKDK